MKNKSTIFITALISIFTFTIALQSMAKTATSNIENLINNNEFESASRAIFLEATSEYNSWPTIPRKQAEAGFLEDALHTISAMPLNMQSSELISLTTLSSISSTKKNEIAKKALDIARKQLGKYPNYLLSGDLTKIALFYSRNNDTPEAQIIFNEALRTAKNGTNEEGSGGYQQITEAMINESTGNRDWMISLLVPHLQREENSLTSAMTYRDLAKVAIQLKRKDVASKLIEQGISAAENSNEANRKKSVLESLADIGDEAGYSNNLLVKSPYLQAIEIARAGNHKKAHAMASKFSNNLYMDHSMATYLMVFDDAAKREDLDTMIYFANHSFNEISYYEANAWRQIAELQIKKGAKNDSIYSYKKALLAISNRSDPIRYLEEVKAKVAIGESMQKNGFEKEGEQIILDSQTLVNFIPYRRTEDRIKANILLSQALWHSGRHNEAKQRIIQAYRATNAYSGNYKWEKTDLLSEIAQTISTFISAN